MKKRICMLLVACSVLLMSGCATSFVKPQPEALTLGKSNSAEIKKAVTGEPLEIKDIQVNGEKVTLITYHYNDGAKFWGLIIPWRWMTYTTFNDVMVGEEFNSTMDGESTEFDASKVLAIEIGKSTKSDVIALLGKPSGSFIYPLTKSKDETGLVYAYTYARFAGILTSTHINRVTVSLNDRNIVTAVSYTKDGIEQIKQ